MRAAAYKSAACADPFPWERRAPIARLQSGAVERPICVSDALAKEQRDFKKLNQMLQIFAND